MAGMCQAPVTNADAQGILKFDPVAGLDQAQAGPQEPGAAQGPQRPDHGSQQNLYFTDRGQTGMADPTGRVYRLSPMDKLDTLVDNGPSANGLALSPDKRFLFVAVTRANQVWRLPLHADGTTSKAGVFFQSFGTAGPDGLKVDEEGNLFVCHPSLGSLFVVDEQGVPKARIVN